MRYHFFLHYGWFFQNLGKEGRRTFMHTTVYQGHRHVWKHGKSKVEISQNFVAFSEYMVLPLVGGQVGL